MSTAAQPALFNPPMENKTTLEGMVMRVMEGVFKSGTAFFSVTLEHHRQGRTRVHTPWMWVFFTGKRAEEARAKIQIGQRLVVTGRLDTHAFELENVKARRTYIDALEFEVRG